MASSSPSRENDQVTVKHTLRGIGCATWQAGGNLDAAEIEEITATTRRWIERFVIDLDLCPFAAREVAKGSVRYAVSSADTEQDLIGVLADELALLEREPDIETTLLIHPGVLGDFLDYNQFLDDCERLLVHLDLEGVYQIASFHPGYQFAGTHPGDAENYSNRSPYPMLHLLREESVEQAVSRYPDVENVPARNLATLDGLGRETLLDMWRSCFRS